MSGEVVRTALGEHFETESLWERHRRHGCVDIADLAELPDNLLDPLSGGSHPAFASASTGHSSIPRPPGLPAARAPTRF